MSPANRPSEKPAPRSSRRRFLRRLLAGGLITTAPVAYARWIEPDRLVVADRRVHLPGWPRGSAGLKIGHLSDFHCDSDRALARTENSVRMLMAQKPDLVLLTGDYLTLNPKHWSAPCARALAPLARVSHGAFAVLGNHDWWCNGDDVITEELTRAGIRVLRNESVPVPGLHGVWLTGLDDLCVRAHRPETALHRVPEDALKLLLIHEPDYADAAPAGFALQLSGHSHGGQIRIPGLPPLITPRYSWRYPEGLQPAQNHLVYTTRGVGVIGPRFRLFCPPEVTLLRIHPSPAPLPGMSRRAEGLV